MFISVSHFFNVLAFLDLTLALLCCILLIKVSSKYAIKFITIPLIVFSSYVLIIQGEDILGRPYDVMPVGQFEFLDYRVTVKDGVKKIELWVIQDKKSRLHVIEYSENYEKELAKAKSRKNKGSRENGKFNQGIKNGQDSDTLSISEIPLEQLLPKKDGPESETIPEKPDESLADKWKFKTNY